MAGAKYIIHCQITTEYYFIIPGQTFVLAALLTLPQQWFILFIEIVTKNVEILLGCLANVVLVAIVTCLLLALSLRTPFEESFLKVSGLFLERDLCSPKPEKTLSY